MSTASDGKPLLRLWTMAFSWRLAERSPARSFYTYGQVSDFRYLTGLTDTGANRAGEAGRNRYGDGVRTGTESRTGDLGCADSEPKAPRAAPACPHVRPRNSWSPRLARCRTAHGVHVDANDPRSVERGDHDPRAADFRGILEENPGTRLESLDNTLQAIRSRKSPAELDRFAEQP